MANQQPNQDVGNTSKGFGSTGSQTGSSDKGQNMEYSSEQGRNAASQKDSQQKQNQSGQSGMANQSGQRQSSEQGSKSSQSGIGGQSEQGQSGQMNKQSTTKNQ